MTPNLGSIIHVRSRQYLVENITVSDRQDGDTVIDLSCLDDDAQGEPLSILWEREIDAHVMGDTPWDSVAQRGFDGAAPFAAYLNAQRWNCVTSTDTELFQAPHRAGIQIKTYQLEPLRKALRMPRVGLFIADDVGLGKTIEAGLILREMLLRQKVKRVVIACPPSVVRQWHEEMAERFGLLFTIVDRTYLTQCRRERGYSTNPWETHTRFIISHALLRDELYAAPLRDWLRDFAPGSMLILDEAHNAAPASGSRYAIDSQFTKVVRDIAPRFEHKLFLSATPHNGHSNSFAALLEMLDPQRFCRGVPIAGASGRQLLNSVMVRRLKRDLRAANVDDRDFPDRQIIPIRINDLPQDSPELELSRLLQEYRRCRLDRLKAATKAGRRAGMLVVISLQKRLLSSIEAFARTLSVHRRAIERQAQQEPRRSHRSPRVLSSESDASRFELLASAPGSDDDRAELSEAEVEAEAEAQMRRATDRDTSPTGPTERELELLAQMTEIAESARYQTDGKLTRLIDWIRTELCPKLGESGGKSEPEWLPRRVLIFTEYADTKRYLFEALSEAIAESDDADRRIATFHGGMGDDRREAIKLAFNSDPAKHPLRILIATDAAREGVNLQNHCADLFHFDIPWNPSRMEQRNGRIDRKLQRSSVVRCHYFVLTQRSEDRVLETLVRKTETIQQELGSLSPVLDRDLSAQLDNGIDREQVEQINMAIDGIDPPETAREELESIRPEVVRLKRDNEDLQKLLDKSQQWLSLDDTQFREALSAALQILNVPGLAAVDAASAISNIDEAQWSFPAIDREIGGDPTWSETLDSLRTPRDPKQKLLDWRRESPIRPVVFNDPGTLDGDVVHLHLEHRIVQRLLGRFRTQGFIHNEMSRACVCRTDESLPKVLIFGRLSLYGRGASRLHDELLCVAAEWREPSLRGGSQLRSLSPTETDRAIAELNTALVTPRLQIAADDPLAQRLKASVPLDLNDLTPQLDRVAADRETTAAEALKKRGQKEAASMRDLLARQRDRIAEQYHGQDMAARQLELNLAEFRQLEADRQYWERRLDRLETEIDTEPQKIRESYRIKTSRIEPIGIAYLYPVSS